MIEKILIKKYGLNNDFIDLKTQQKFIRRNIDKRISDVLNHGQYIQGPEIWN